MVEITYLLRGFHQMRIKTTIAVRGSHKSVNIILVVLGGVVINRGGGIAVDNIASRYIVINM